MKVAYNGCYGGFSLSPIAETQYRAKKGISITWYEGVGDYPYAEYQKIDVEKVKRGGSIFRFVASNKDLGDKVDKIPDENYFYESWYGEKYRSDPDLIEVIESLGDKANGECAKLYIKEIPDGAQFEITEYDGIEDVVPPRQSW